MKLVKLEAATRQVVGKGLKRLRREGVTPVHLYGPGVPSASLQVDTVALEKVLRQVGTGHPISITVGSSRKGLMALIREVQRDYLTGAPLHVDFFQVKADEEVVTEVPISITGESPAVKAGLGTLLVNMQHIKVECLPEDIPTSIEADIGHLDEPGHAIHVEDLKPVAGCILQASPTEMVVKVVARRKVEPEEVKEAEVKAEEAIEAVEGEAEQAP
jgi:large subunit ribosomal protein L25